MIPKAALRERGVDLSPVADQVESGDSSIRLERAFGAFDDDPASVVATHDIHCDSHKGVARGRTPGHAPATVRRQR